MHASNIVQTGVARRAGFTRRFVRASGRASLALLLAASLGQADTLVVNSTGDRVDQTPGNGSCFTGTTIVITLVPLVQAPECTLRAAIQEANALSGTDTINFALAVPPTDGYIDIAPDSPLPPIQTRMTISGANHFSSGAPMVQLSGENLVFSGSGLTFIPGSFGSIVSRLSITQFPDYGVLIEGSFGLRPNNIHLEYNQIGIARGETVAGNGRGGVEISGGNEIYVGGDCSATTCSGGNLISGNGGFGIRIFGNDNRVQDNYIGTTSDGESNVTSLGHSTGNFGAGIVVLENSFGSRIGFDANGASPTLGCNIISGNHSNGIHNLGRSTQIHGNFVGTNRLGTAALPNLESGIVDEGESTTIGLHSGAGRNLIAGNADDGIVLFGSEAVVTANFIGVGAGGSTPIPNGQSGIYEEGDDSTLEANVIGGNLGNGIHLNGASTSLFNNRIGTNDSAEDIGNGGAGLYADGASHTIGFLTEPNLIGHNAGPGIYIPTTGRDHSFSFNLVGTNGTGQDLGNGGDGIECWGSRIEFGAFDGVPGLNIIGHNDGHGLSLRGSASDVLVLGNYIGLTLGEDEAGNQGSGLYLDLDGPGQRNVVGDDLDFLSLYDPNRTANRVAWNAGDAVTVVGNGDTRITGTLAWSNAGDVIDLADDGPTANDPDDADAGPHGFQNTPEFDIAATHWDSASGELVIRFRVDVPGLPSAPLGPWVDFYLYDPWREPGDQARVWVGSSALPSDTRDQFRTVRITPPAGSFVPDASGILFGGLRATADWLEGTSELSAQNVPVPEPDGLSALAVGILGMISFAATRRSSLSSCAPRSRDSGHDAHDVPFGARRRSGPLVGCVPLRH